MKILVSEDISFLEDRRAFVQTLFWRKIGLGSADSVFVVSPSARTAREASSREPMW